MSRRSYWMAGARYSPFALPQERTRTVRWSMGPGYVRVAAFENATGDEVVAAIGDATRDPRFVRGMGLLLDGGAVTADAEEASQLHDEMRDHADGIAALGFGRWALIAATEAQGSGAQAAPYGSVSAQSALPTAVFSDVSSAEQWLLRDSRH